jgi:hypothetical protein
MLRNKDDEFSNKHVYHNIFHFLLFSKNYHLQKID